MSLFITDSPPKGNDSQTSKQTNKETKKTSWQTLSQLLTVLPPWLLGCRWMSLSTALALLVAVDQIVALEK